MNPYSYASDFDDVYILSVGVINDRQERNRFGSVPSGQWTETGVFC